MATYYEIKVTWMCPSSRKSHPNEMEFTLPINDDEDIEDVILAMVSDTTVQQENPCVGLGKGKICGHIGFCDTDWTYRKI